MYIVYGIKNCNTVKKSLTYLDEHKIAYRFHDYKKEGITKAKLKDWSSQLGWEKLVNKKGSTWRMLDDATKNKVTSETKAIELMMEKTSVIKRPLIENGTKVIALGFEEEVYHSIDW
ncbi:ArsC family reductase [Arachidicoccus soli]|uniref:ArsC family reductase n=1 Tax=Arachidicoccus soli TaxID=2341117 RepID=A0A386HLQ4_9BACT|nr:ArsC family reductase [Arachidicoccus soli]AYD46715.1 ArsC family reductase [Arachidicoccus soli]